MTSPLRLPPTRSIRVQLRNNSIACAQASNGWKQRGHSCAHFIFGARLSLAASNLQTVKLCTCVPLPLQIFAAWRLSVKKIPVLMGSHALTQAPAGDLPEAAQRYFHPGGAGRNLVANNGHLAGGLVAVTSLLASHGPLHHSRHPRLLRTTPSKYCLVPPVSAVRSRPPGRMTRTASSMT
jgi:hypothetical protein